MNANIVNILMWTKPAKTSAILITVNIILWFLTRQRPLGVLGIFGIFYYLRYIWRHRWSSQVLLDPPDTEEWVNLSSYDMHNALSIFVTNSTNSWLNFRHNSHLLWAVGTCMGWLILAKLGSQIDFLTMLFFLSNAAFVIFPIMEVLPKNQQEEIVRESVTDRKDEEVVEHWYTSTTSSRPEGLDFDLSSSPPSSPLSETQGLFPKAMSMVTSTSPFVSRTLGSAATSLMTSTSSLFSNKDLLNLNNEETEPESLTPAMTQMPGYDEIDSDNSEDEFLLDAHHFDKSSSSSVSNSFEIIDDNEDQS